MDDKGSPLRSATATPAPSHEIHDPQEDNLVEITGAFARLKTCLGFLDLPAEIRNTIYELISEPIAPIATFRHVPARNPYPIISETHMALQLPLMIHTCRQIRQEVLSLWLPKHRIITESMVAALRWTNASQQQLSKFVTSFSIETTRSATMMPESHDAIHGIPGARPYGLTMTPSFSANLSTKTSRAPDHRLFYHLRILGNLKLASDIKELIRSKPHTMFDHKERITLRDFILVGDQLAHVPFQVVPDISLERRDGSFTVLVREQLEGPCTVSSERGERT